MTDTPNPPQFQESPRGDRGGAPAWLVAAAFLLLLAAIGLQQFDFTTAAQREAQKADQDALRNGTKIPTVAHEQRFPARLIAAADEHPLGDMLTGRFTADAVPTNKDIAAARIRQAALLVMAGNKDEALGLLPEIETDLAPDSELHEDAAALRDLAQTGVTTQERAAAFERRHGEIGRLVVELAPDAPPANPSPTLVRARDIGMAAILLALGGVLVGGAAFIAGVVLLIVYGVRAHARRGVQSGFLRVERSLHPSEPADTLDRRVWLETFVVFVGGFLAVNVLALIASKSAPPGATWPVWFGLGGQWLLLAAPFWPVLRGIPLRDVRLRIGWHAPRGVAREIASGIGMYLAFLPVLLVIGAAVYVLNEALGGPKPTNKVDDMLGGGGPAAFIAVVLLATVWAPLVEESIFRGALYRHLRGRARFSAALLVSAGAFAFMHAYAPVQLALVFSLGSMFAVMRERTGSLIPSMTAHFIQNSMAVTMMIVVMKLGEP